MRATITTSILLLALGTSGAQSGSPDAGQEIYEQHCATCHAASNIMVASPKLHNGAQWAARLQAGFDAVLGNAITGINAMPTMGSCETCTVDEIEVAIRYMAAPALPTPPEK